MNFSIIKAGQDQFAIFQTMYSNADYNMWYDWEQRLQDTKWTNECYFVLLDEKKIGGYIAVADTICYPFLIAPYANREEFWRFVLEQNSKRYINGVSEADVEVLQDHEYRILSGNQVMCRPTEQLCVNLNQEFTCMGISEYRKQNADYLLGKLIVDGYKGSICNEIFGEATVDLAVDDMLEVLAVYHNADYSKVILDRDNQLAALCLAGTGDHYLNNYAEIADLCVLPRYRGKGLARYLITNVLSSAYGKSPYVKLLVHKGNTAETLYREMGFISGPVFYNMEK